MTPMIRAMQAEEAEEVAALVHGLARETRPGVVPKLTAADLIASGEANIVLAGGVESMSRAPLVVEKGEEAYTTGNRTIR